MLNHAALSGGFFVLNLAALSGGFWVFISDKKVA